MALDLGNLGKNRSSLDFNEQLQKAMLMMQLLQQEGLMEGGGQQGGGAVNAPVIDHSTMDHSAMGGAPMQAPGPGGLAGARQILERPGVFDDLTSRQVPPNAETNLRLGGLERTRQLGLDTALEARDQEYQPSTFDKIARYGGIAALGIGALVGNKNRDLSQGLGVLAGVGLNYAGGRERQFRTDQYRDFRNQTAQRNAEFGAESAPLLAMQRQMMGENKAAAANRTFAGQDLSRLIGIENVELRGREADLSAGKGAVLTTDRAIAPYVKRALDKMAAGQPFDAVDLWAIEHVTKGLSTKATAPNIRLAGRNLEDLRSTQGDIIGRELDILGPSDIDEFPRKRIGSKEFTAGPRDVGRLQDIARRSRTGDLRLPSVRERDFGTFGEGIGAFFGRDKDTLIANEPLATAADSAITLAGRTRDDLIQQDPDYYGVEGVDTLRVRQAPQYTKRQLADALAAGAITQVEYNEAIRNAR